MKTLNLVYPDKSDIDFKIYNFPDGQQNIVILGLPYNSTATNYGEILDKNAKAYSKLDKREEVKIKSRLNNWLDLELITCAVASLRELGVEEIQLYAPYIVGSRSDRKFEEGGNNYLKDAICPVINSLNFKTVTCIDPHSDILEACIKGFKKQDNEDVVNFSLNNIYSNIHPSKQNNFILISPDAGASKKIYKLAKQIGYEGEIIICSKERDEKGNLSRTVVPVKFEHVGKDFIIVDDIIDGGATFINIAKELKKQFEGSATKNRIFLIITHGIFSKGIDELSVYFDNIFCTNSYQDCNPDEYGIINNSPFIKQLNIF